MDCIDSSISRSRTPSTSDFADNATPLLRITHIDFTFKFVKSLFDSDLHRMEEARENL
jgi:hypothetical protein